MENSHSKRDIITAKEKLSQQKKNSHDDKRSCQNKII